MSKRFAMHRGTATAVGLAVLLGILWVRKPGTVLLKALGSDPDRPAVGVRINPSIGWQSPAVPVKPNKFYRLIVSSRTAEKALCGAVFFNSAGEELDADHYTGIDVSAVQQSREYFFRSRHDAETLRLRFIPSSRRSPPLYLQDLKLTRATPRQVMAWSDSLLDSLPPVHYAPPPDRWRYLPQTHRRLQRGQPLRWLLLGDSIANDTGNAPFDLRIQRHYRGSRIQVIGAVQGNTPYAWFTDSERFDQMVVQHDPDLIFITAISHRHETQAIEDLIDLIRARTHAEILLSPGPVATESYMLGQLMRRDDIHDETAATAVRAEFRQRLATIAADRQVAFFDMRTAWNDYLQEADLLGFPAATFLRDTLHANERGQQVLARMLELHFRP